MKDRGIDHLDVDPFVSSHSVEENDNGAIDAVAKEWVSIAQQTRAAVSLTHHVRKPNGSEPSAHDARGASAMVNAARSVLVFQRMRSEEPTSELQSLMRSSYAVFCLKKKKQNRNIDKSET